MRHAAFALALLVTGCDTATDAVDTDTAPATFTEVREEILLKSCALSSCHGAGNGSAELRFGVDAATDHAELVGAASSALPEETRVVAGDADASYLVKKLEGLAGIDGDEMPPGAMLSEEKIARVRSWIDAGAAND